MKYFNNGTDVHGYDETVETDAPYIDAAIAAGWVDVTASWPPAPPAPTEAEVVASYQAAVQNELDAYAVSMKYESILSMASYANSTNDQFKAEALAALAWRDNVWSSCYATLAAVQAGTQPMPVLVEAFVATLPAHP